MVKTTIAFDYNDVRKLDSLLKRFQAELGKTPKQAVQWGTVKVIQSLRASTKTAPQRRKVYKLTGPEQKKIFPRDGLLPFKVQGWGRTGEKSWRYIFYKSIEQAQSSLSAFIKYSGMAAQSWGWAMAALFGRDVGSGSRRKYRQPAGAMETTKIDQPGKYGISITNRLRYIEKAFRQKGDTAVSSAIFRANKGMEKQINDRLFKASQK
jgi:hypothetical protein